MMEGSILPFPNDTVLGYVPMAITSYIVVSFLSCDSVQSNNKKMSKMLKLLNMYLCSYALICANMHTDNIRTGYTAAYTC